MRLTRTGVLVTTLVAAASGCSDGFNFGVPDPVSEQGRQTLELWRGFHWTAVAVGLLIWGLVVYCMVRYRRRGDGLPRQSHENIPMEILYTVIPLVVVGVLFAFTVGTQQEVVDLAEDPDVVIDVIGFQWSWQFDYPEEGISVTSDGVAAPEIVVPVGSTVRFRLTTTDVNHSFWVPRFLVKRDLIPNVDNEFDVDVTEAGTWEGRCAEFCGLDHYRMNFSVWAVPAEYYTSWVDNQREIQVAAGEAGSS